MTALSGNPGSRPESIRVIERISARASSVRIELRPDGSVLLVIPRRVPKAYAYDFLRSKESWIQRKASELRAKTGAAASAELRWDGQDTLPLWGLRVPLHRLSSRVGQPYARIHATAITVFAPPDTSNTTLERTLRAALRRLARNESRRMLDIEAARLGLSYEGPRIADQRSLWGSCTARGLISLNWRLVLAPPEVLRYVVVHELCHRRHHDHSDRFWQLVEAQMPGHEKWRQWLRQHGSGLHMVLTTSASAPDHEAVQLP